MVTLDMTTSYLLPVRGVVGTLEPEEALLALGALLPGGLVRRGASVEARVKYNPDRTGLLISSTLSAVPEVLARDVCWPGEESIGSGAVGGRLWLLCRKSFSELIMSSLSYSRKRGRPVQLTFTG